MEVIKILRTCDQQMVRALIMPAKENHLQQWMNIWKPQLEDGKTWDKDAQWEKVTPNYETYVLESDGQLQGLMTIEVCSHLSWLEHGAPLVYISSLLSAPWNRGDGLYKGIGSALMAIAVLRSFDLSYDGRVGVHSHSEALGFYAKMLMTNWGWDADHRLTYFELEPEDAICHALNVELTPLVSHDKNSPCPPICLNDEYLDRSNITSLLY